MVFCPACVYQLLWKKLGALENREPGQRHRDTKWYPWKMDFKEDGSVFLILKGIGV